jgi:Na+-transporting methylmalonyl-CoA/oxaloacetate decarboxylase gamma subunit
MIVDWSYAGQIGGVGFGMVFAILLILMFFIWLTGKVLIKINASKSDKAIEKKPPSEQQTKTSAS